MTRSGNGFPEGMAAEGRVLKATTRMAKLACAKNALILTMPGHKSKKPIAQCDGLFLFGVT